MTQNDRSFSFEKITNIPIKKYIIDETSIPNRLFYKKNIINGRIEFPDNVVLVGCDAFAHNHSIYFYKTNKIKYIDSRAFQDSGITKFNFNFVSKIGDRAFKNNSFIEGLVNIPDTCESIGDEAFYNCEFKYIVKIYGSSIKELGDRIFTHSDIKSVKFIDIPFIGNGMFSDCNDLSRVTFDGNSCKSIMNCSFKSCRSLKSIIIPKGVEYIGYGAFENCINLCNIHIPDTVESINYRAFLNISNDAKIYIPSNNKLNDLSFLADFKYKNIIYI